jgi:hypothetical protein
MVGSCDEVEVGRWQGVGGRRTRGSPCQTPSPTTSRLPPHGLRSRGSRKPEAGSRKPEAGSRKPEAGSRLKNKSPFGSSRQASIRLTAYGSRLTPRLCDEGKEVGVGRWQGVGGRRTGGSPCQTPSPTTSRLPPHGLRSRASRKPEAMCQRECRLSAHC